MNSVSSSKADRYISLVLLAFCAFVVAQTWQMKIPANVGKTSPSFVPYLMVFLLGACALGLLFRSFKAVDNSRVELPSGAIWLKLLAFVVLMIAYALALVPVGYIGSTIAVFFLGLWILGERNWLSLCAFPTAMTLIVYFGFTKLLSVWLP